MLGRGRGRGGEGEGEGERFEMPLLERERDAIIEMGVAGGVLF